MNRIKKSIITVLIVIIASFSLSACGTAKADIDPEIEMTLLYTADQTFQQIISLDDNTIDQYIEQFTYEQDTISAGGFKSWKTAKYELGNFLSITDADVKKKSGGYTVTFMAHFENRDCEFVLGSDLQMRKITVIEFNPVYSLGEKMGQAATNLVTGMGTVFAVLVFLTLIISLFKYVNMAEERFKSKRFVKKETEYSGEKAADASEKTVSDDEELKAVIAAAIAAYEADSINSCSRQKKLDNGICVRSYRRGGEE